MKIYSIIKNLVDLTKNLRSLGSINPSTTMTITIPSSHYGLIMLHASYSSLTAIVEYYCNSTGVMTAKVMAVPEGTTTKSYTITTSTNTVTIANNHSSGYITNVQVLGIDAKNITYSTT